MVQRPEVLTLHLEEPASQTLFVDVKDPRRKMVTWVVLCQALKQSIGQEEWTEIHEKLMRDLPKSYRKEILSESCWVWKAGVETSSVEDMWRGLRSFCVMGQC